MLTDNLLSIIGVNNLRGNAGGTQITLVYKVQFLCGPPSFLDGYKNMHMTDTTDIL